MNSARMILEKGTAFLLVRELAHVRDLRSFLRDRCASPPAERRRFARRLGRELARLHAAGFDHPDLYSKHVLVGPADGRITLVDWQRSRRRRQTYEIPVPGMRTRPRATHRQ